MEKSILKKHIGKQVVITLKPNSFVLVGKIDQVFEDSIQFSTRTKTSYLDFDAILTLRIQDE